MEQFLYYLLRASVLMALFYGFYKLFFGKNTFHRFNRFSLILIAMLVAALPLFRFNLLPEKEAPPVTETFTMDFSEIPVTEFVAPQPSIEIPWIGLLSAIFAIGFLFALVRYLIGLGQLVSIIRRSDKQTLADDTVLCVTDTDISPFSWMRYIVLSRKDVSADNRAIINHERAHIHLYHSLDMIFFDLFTCAFWFNPFSWLLRREVQSVHEYQADEQVLNNGIDAKQYQLLLIRKSVGEHKFALANNFRQRDLHKRITMMMKNKTNNRKKWAYAIGLPVLAMAMIVLSVPKLNAKVVEKEVENISKNETITTPVKDSLIIANQTVDVTQNPLELGSVEIRAKENLKDEKLTVSGRVQGKDGFMAGVAVVIKGSNVGTITDPQGNFVIKAEKGDVLRFAAMGYKASEYTVEKDQTKLSNVLQPDDVVETGMVSDLKGEVAGVHTNENQSRIEIRGASGAIGQKPLIIVDGVEVETMDNVKPDDIESISVLKDASAKSIYGDKGKDGVVLITTKQGDARLRGVTPDKKPLYVIDGKKMPKDFEIISIQPDEIESIDVLKDNAATAIYGEDGKNGVIIITKKDAEK